MRTNSSSARSSARARAPLARDRRHRSRARGAGRRRAAVAAASFVPGNASALDVFVYDPPEQFSRYAFAFVRSLRSVALAIADGEFALARRLSKRLTRRGASRAPRRRFDALEEHHVNFPKSYAYDAQTKVVAPARYRVTLPKGYDAKRAKAYECVVCVPGEAGFGPRDGKSSLSANIAKTNWNDERGVILVEVVFNTPTWLNDSSTRNHESYLMRVVLPHFRAAHNAGTMSLLGYGTGGFGALSTFLRYPTTFDRVVAADAPILGGYKSVEREWGNEDLKRGARWGSFDAAFPNDSDWAPYAVDQLTQDPWTLEQLNSRGRPRVALLPGNKTSAELADFSEHLAERGVAHDVIEGFETADIGREGAWIAAAVKWLDDTS